MEALVDEEGSLLSYDDYDGWELDESELYELVNGDAFAMVDPNTRHQEILMALLNRFYNHLQGKGGKVFSAPYEVRLFYEEDKNDDTVVHPDILVVCDKNKLGPHSCNGAPDLVVEILSIFDMAIEVQQRFKLYQRAGIREYWMVDPKNNGLTVFCFQKEAILTNIYGSTDTVQVGIFPDLSISLGQIFAE